MYFLLASVLSIYGCNSRVKEKEIAISFAKALLNDSVKSEVVAEKYVKYDARGRDFLIWQMDLIRADFRKRGIKPNDLKVVTGKEAGEKLRKMNIQDMDIDQVLVVLNKDTLLFPIMIPDDKIESFATMNKGGRRYFMTY